MGDEILQQIERAERRGEERASDPRASAVSVAGNPIALKIELTSGCSAQIPLSLIEGLAGATIDDVENVEILGRGIGLHWDKLDIDLSVPELLAGVFGTRKWMNRERAAKAGAATSSRKAEAAKRNGAKGGRPRKSAAAS